jgi:hypothetical protein
MNDVVGRSLLAVLANPDPPRLRQLQADLLQAELALSPQTWQLLTEFYDYLVALFTRTNSREYSHFASLLDIGAVGSVALQHILNARGEANFWWTLLLNGVGEGLMITAARQYVKAWEGEMAAVHEQAAWKVQQAFWHISRTLQPQLDAGERRRHLEQLFSPLHHPGTQNTLRAVLLVRYFQVLLLAHLHLDLQEAGDPVA